MIEQEKDKDWGFPGHRCLVVVYAIIVLGRCSRMGHGKLCFQPCSLMSMVRFHPWPEDANQDLSGAQKEKKQPGVRHDSCGPAFILCDNFVFFLLENWPQHCWPEEASIQVQLGSQLVLPERFENESV